MRYSSKWPNHPAKGKAGIAPWLAIEHHRPGLPEPGRSTSGYNKMRALLLCVTFLLSVCVSGQESMTAERFRSIVASRGDTNALRRELAVLPFWRNTKTEITLKYQDGKTFKEECIGSAKTVGGRYIVFSMESQFYKQTMLAITGFDERANAIRQWGLFGDTVTEGTVVVDPEKKVSAWTSAYGDGYTEIQVSTYSDTEATDHALVYKQGVLFMTRDAKTYPISEPKKVEPSGPANGSQPIRSETNRTSAAGSRR
jgi:hypothetical protein